MSSSTSHQLVLTQLNTRCGTHRYDVRYKNNDIDTDFGAEYLRKVTAPVAADEFTSAIASPDAAVAVATPLEDDDDDEELAPVRVLKDIPESFEFLAAFLCFLERRTST